MRSVFSFLLLVLFATPVLAGSPADEYAARRAELARQIGPDGILILMSPPPSQRNGDVDWPYRQEDSLLYLTGLGDPETSLVLTPGDAERKESVFTRDSDPASEVWTGRIPTFAEVTALSGVKNVSSSSQLSGFVSSLLERHGGQQSLRDGKTVVWMILENRSFGGDVSAELKYVEQLRRSYPELQFRDAFPLLAAMRQIKSPAEIATVQHAIDVTVAAQKAAMQRVQSAQHEYEIQATIEYTFRNLGACCWAFPSIAASGRNTTTLHYETNNDAVVPGALMLTDIGAEVDGYSADVTRTYPQSGHFSTEQRAIYEAVLRAQSETIPKMKAGVSMRDVHNAAVGILGEELLKLGLISQNKPEQVRLYFFHGLGHQLGLRTHDVGDYRGNLLKAGMIVTDEPGIYVRPTDVHASPTYLALTAAERTGIDAALVKYADIGVRIEDDILITDGAPRNLSGAAPRTVEEVERFMQASAP
jgi:Xaa-Pro aminopeptidase